LARNIAYQTANANFKQDVIDYTWLLDKFESETLEAETKRKVEIENAKFPNAQKTPDPTPEEPKQFDENELVFTVYTENYEKKLGHKSAGRFERPGNPCRSGKDHR
jgi:hypothetical protein